MKKNKLSNITTKSIGLVYKGKVKLDDGSENIFLIKSEDAMSDELEDVVILDDTDPNALQSLQKKLVEWFPILAKQEEGTPSDDVAPPKVEEPVEKGEITKEALAQAAKALGMSVEKLGTMMDGYEEEDDPMKKSDNSLVIDQILKAQEAQVEAAIAKAKTEMESVYKSQIDTLTGEVETLRKAKDEADDTLAKQDLIAKAAMWRMLPQTPEQVGGLLHTIRKSVDKETFEQVEELFKAADAQMGAGAMFAEFGHSITPQPTTVEGEVQQLMKAENISYEDALLKLPPYKQQLILNQSRGGK